MFRALLFTSMIPILIASCSPISSEMRREAGPPVPFPHLLQSVDRYQGKTVILGGYILEVDKSPHKTRFCVLQAPLNFRLEPVRRERSEGKFVVSYQGFLSARRYRSGRPITVAGRVVGLTERGMAHCPGFRLEIEYREMYVKPEYERAGSPPYYDQALDPWESPYPTRW
jgi:outer membrane lipoprotein